MNMTKLILAMGLVGLASASQAADDQSQRKEQPKKPTVEQVTGFGSGTGMGTGGGVGSASSISGSGMGAGSGSGGGSQSFGGGITRQQSTGSGPLSTNPSGSTGSNPTLTAPSGY